MVQMQGETRDGNSIPVASMVESIVGCKWSVRLLGLLASGVHRPNALLRSCPGLSAKVMNERLRKMLRFSIVQRTVFGKKPPLEVEYRLTEFGYRFIRILDEVHRLQDAVNTGAFSKAATEDVGAAGSPLTLRFRGGAVTDAER